MKRNLWISLMVFSLALNLGGLVTFGYLRYHGHREVMTDQNPPPQSLREIWRTLNLETEQRRVLESLLPNITAGFRICGRNWPKEDLNCLG